MNGAAQMYARGTIDAGQLETITAETDQAIGKIRVELSAATAKSPLADFAATEDARRTWENLTLGCKREVLRHLITVTLPPPGRGHVFTRDLIQIGPPGSLTRSPGKGNVSSRSVPFVTSPGSGSHCDARQ
jgi:hypothetical protein